jgi:septum formation inhibitor MinC
VLQATADSLPLQTPGTAVAPTAKGSSGSSGSNSSSDAVYIKAPIAAGATLEHPDSSVVVLGDVPQSARIRAGGDIIIMGT